MPSPKTAIKPVYALVGESLYLRREALENILRAIREEYGDAPQTSSAEGRHAELADVLDEVRTVSMFSARRVVVVDEAEPFITRYREPLERYVASPAPTGTLVLLCKSIDRRTRLAKALAAADAVVACEPLKGSAVPGWIIRRAREAYGKAISERAATLIRELAGNDLGILDMELAKLAAYAGTRGEITATDVDHLVGQCREENVFALLDAMADGDMKLALERWHQVIATDPAAKDRSIGGLAWGVRRLREAQEALDSGESIHALARRMFTDAARLEHRLGRVTRRQLEERLSDLLAIDLGAKSGGGTVPIGVEKWIIKHSQEAGDRSPGGAVRGPRWQRAAR